MTPTQAQIEAAHQIRVWLGRNATAETNPEKKAAFIEAHNVALKIEEAALAAAAEAGGDPCWPLRLYRWLWPDGFLGDSWK